VLGIQEPGTKSRVEPYKPSSLGVPPVPRVAEVDHLGQAELTRAYSSLNIVQQSMFCFVPRYASLVSGRISSIVLNFWFIPAKHVVPSRLQVIVVVVIVIVDRAADLESDHLNGGWYSHRYWILNCVTLRTLTAWHFPELECRQEFEWEKVILAVHQC